ncbi:ATP-grasp domain-containing protein [Nocardia sp. NPDC059239]|uniref:D-alanine--D-alanine ligase family protein n=1 Tax=Nocardia sp. NPDC059239 TaxID=3346785 RepID=UPI003695F7B8
MQHPLILLVGGRSTEHDASLHSYRRVITELLDAADRFAVQAVVHIDRKEGARIITGPPWPLTESEFLIHRSAPLREAIAFLQDEGCFTFSLLHGTEGEDGCWQGLTEILDIRGSFGSVLSSAVGMDKRIQAVLADAVVPDLRVPRTVAIDRRHRASGIELAAAAFEGSAVVVKPNRMGASLLTTALTGFDGAAVEDLVREIHEFSTTALVQQYITGTEISCGILVEDGHAQPLPVLAIDTAERFFGHDQKHRRGGAAVTVNTGAEATLAQRASVRLFEHLDLFGWARFDYIAAPDGVYFLEVNTIPGLMHGSLFPRMLAEHGRSIPDLIDCCIQVGASMPSSRKQLPYEIGH